MMTKTTANCKLQSLFLSHTCLACKTEVQVVKYSSKKCGHHVYTCTLVANNTLHVNAKVQGSTTYWPVW